jgi:hypothetical protein
MNVHLQPSNATQEKQLIVIHDEGLLHYRGVEGIECYISRRGIDDSSLTWTPLPYGPDSPQHWKNLGTLKLISAQTLEEVVFNVLVVPTLKRYPVATEVFFGKLLHDVAKNCSLIINGEGSVKRYTIQQARHSERCMLGDYHLDPPSEYLRF